MRKVKLVVLAVLVLTLTSITLLGRHQEQKQIHETGATEEGVRHEATFTVMPTYPEEAIRAGAQGFFDAAVRFDDKGNFDRIKVLESPHPAISKAVEEALKQWKMRVTFTGDGLPYSLYGELRFHFIIEDGRARVENPSLEEQKNRSRAFIKATNEYLRNPRSQQQP
jgi:TonB family protein